MPEITEITESTNGDGTANAAPSNGHSVAHARHLAPVAHADTDDAANGPAAKDSRQDGSAQDSPGVPSAGVLVVGVPLTAAVASLAPPAPASPAPVAQHDAPGATAASEPRFEFERMPVMRYLDADRTPTYRPIVRILYDNKNNLVTALRLSNAAIAEQLTSRYSIGIDAEDLDAALTQLWRWGVIDRAQDLSRAANHREFKRKRFTYDITIHGERVERLAQELATLTEQVGALEGSRLPAILRELTGIVTQLERASPEPVALRDGLSNLAGALHELRQGASDFMSQLAKVMTSTEAVNSEEFHDYKRDVIEHLEGFAHELARYNADIVGRVRRVQTLGAERLIALAAQADHAVALGRSDEDVQASREVRPREQWDAVLAWFVGKAKPRRGAP